MSRINTNIPSLVAQRILGNNNRDLNTSLTRLSTGLKINSGKDDPAGLIASEQLRSEKVALNAAMYNISRADNVIATAEGGLVEINSLLLELEDLIDKSSNEAGISQDERDANQLQIDSILESINRFANTTEFQGKRLLSGELDYDVSSIATSQLANVRINAAKIPDGGNRSVTVEVAASAQTAEVVWSASAIAIGTAGSVTIEVAGNLGTEVLTFAESTTNTAMASAINQSKDVTGVSAKASGSLLMMNSTSYGDDQYVSVKLLDETTGSDFKGDLRGGTSKSYGVNAEVKINGATAITDGLTASIRTNVLSVDIDLDEAFGTMAGSTTSTFQITGGGADFNISPTVNMAGKVSLGIGSVSTGSLGKTGLGFLSDLATGQTNALATGNYSAAQRIVREANSQVSVLRGRLGAFQKDTLETTRNALQVTYENTTAAESVIRDTDFAQETAALTRSQILVQSATNTLRMANQNPQNVLSLLG